MKQIYLSVEEKVIAFLKWTIKGKNKIRFRILGDAFLAFLIWIVLDSFLSYESHDASLFIILILLFRYWINKYLVENTRTKLEEIGGKEITNKLSLIIGFILISLWCFDRVNDIEYSISDVESSTFDLENQTEDLSSRFEDLVDRIDDVEDLRSFYYDLDSRVSELEY